MRDAPSPERREHVDFERIMQALKDVGFDGYYSIEFEGQGEAMDGVQKTKTLLEKYL